MYYFWGDTKTVTIDAEEVIGDIPSRILDEEYKQRKELQRDDPKQAEREERCRYEDIDIDISLDEYNLIDKDTIELTDFGENDIITYLENNGYSVFQNSCISKDECFGVTRYLNEVPDWKFKELLCDTLGLTHLATKEEIINKIKDRL